MELESLGLFPLHAVLVPGAALGLRVFEPRYLDLVRDCGRNGGGFGICLIMDGEEAGAAAKPAAFGTEAVIEDFDTDDMGVLMLRVRGRRRFRVARTRVRDNGLVVGEVEWREPDPDEELRPEHGLLALLLQRILEQAGGEHADAPAARFDDAAWVGWRLSELLPLANLQRQALLQEDDPHARLQQLLGWVSDELK
ncbi:MAG: ATP-dependent protease [Lysobacteraceae bacterium]|nr:MAG: ATP-dependent protease [Xanthomonadaceae bacterium]